MDRILMNGKEKQDKRTELLAPAGNYESFLGAIHAGADAVYLAGERFGARAYADNFSTEELCRAIRYAHLYDRRVYLTLNTLVKESEFAAISMYLKPFYEEGLDGIIVQDMGVLSYVRREFPELPIHISTQAMVTGPAGARFLKEQGAVRIVPARELSLSEIRQIKEETGLELETFIHGAMCYCYSGQCLFSSIAGGRSGNRGRCAQPCRLPYQLDGNGRACLPRDSYPLSLKDLCTIQDLPALLAAGIDSFKIEGRMKKPEYAAGVTAIYRKYMDLWYEHPENEFHVQEADWKKLSSLYIRSDVQNGYYFRQNGAEMITISSPAYSGSDERVLEEIRTKYLIPEEKIGISAYLTCKVGEPLCLMLSIPDSDCCIRAEGPLVERAAKLPVEEAVLREKISRFGNTFFEVQECRIESDSDCFVPVKALNELRRQAAEQLEDAILKQKKDTIQNHGQGIKAEDGHTRKMPVSLKGGFSVLVSTAEQLQECIVRADSIDRVYVESTLFTNYGKLTNHERLINHEKLINFETPLDEAFLVQLYRLKEKNAALQLFVALPFVLRAKDGMYFTRLREKLQAVPIDGWLIRNVEELGEFGTDAYGMLALDAGLYCFNREAVEFYKSFADTLCLPYELNHAEKKQLMSLNKEISYEQVIYGRIPMMITANCIAKTAGRCSGKEKQFFLTDRYKHKFPVRTVCSHCYNIIWNCLPLSLHRNFSDYQNCLKRLQFTTESGAEAGQLLDYFLGSKRNTGIPFPIKEYTAGHERRGVE